MSKVLLLVVGGYANNKESETFLGYRDLKLEKCMLSLISDLGKLNHLY